MAAADTNGTSGNFLASLADANSLLIAEVCELDSFFLVR